MKPITEYNFREIMDRFVIINIPNVENLDLEYENYVAYCYIDTENGISFSVYGGYKDGNIYKMNNGLLIIRYSDSFKLEIYNSPTEEMNQRASQMKELYTMSDWIEKVRLDTRYDRYRDNAFPDDMLLIVRTPKDASYDNYDQIEEVLWTRPISILNNGDLIGITIEDGAYIKKNSIVWIWENTDEDNTIVAVTEDWINMLNKYSEKEEE